MHRVNAYSAGALVFLVGMAWRHPNVAFAVGASLTLLPVAGYWAWFAMAETGGEA